MEVMRGLVESKEDSASLLVPLGGFPHGGGIGR